MNQRITTHLVNIDHIMQWVLRAADLTDVLEHSNRIQDDVSACLLLGITISRKDNSFHHSSKNSISLRVR